MKKNPGPNTQFLIYLYLSKGRRLHQEGFLYSSMLQRLRTGRCDTNMQPRP